ncbi:MAG: hypothetical protein GDA48_17120 [Hormoscilla sp. GM102CHS1]|nr:hypothetical protein [Hormoscilla sp. GM102CHS1]
MVDVTIGKLCYGKRCQIASVTILTKIDRGLNYALRLLKLEAMGDKIADIDILCSRNL